MARNKAQFFIEAQSEITRRVGPRKRTTHRWERVARWSSLEEASRSRNALVKHGTRARIVYREHVIVDGDGFFRADFPDLTLRCDECGGPYHVSPTNEIGYVHCHTLGCSICGNPDHLDADCPFRVTTTTYGNAGGRRVLCGKRTQYPMVLYTDREIENIQKRFAFIGVRALKSPTFDHCGYVIVLDTRLDDEQITMKCEEFTCSIHELDPEDARFVLDIPTIVTTHDAIQKSLEAEFAHETTAAQFDDPESPERRDITERVVELSELHPDTPLGELEAIARAEQGDASRAHVGEKEASPLATAKALLGALLIAPRVLVTSAEHKLAFDALVVEGRDLTPHEAPRLQSLEITLRVTRAPRGFEDLAGRPRKIRFLLDVEDDGVMPADESVTILQESLARLLRGQQTHDDALPEGSFTLTPIDAE